MRTLFATLITLSLFVSAVPFVRGADIYEDQLNAAKNASKLVNAQPGRETVGVQSYVGKVINIFLSLLGTIAIVLIVYAGFLWMTAGGNEESLTKAKDLLLNAVIGLAIILTAYSITRSVLNALISK